eukprot:TRINITY_DN1180_c1_g1_i8.p1 TRINITY_DN1180_c1_g1~~TRINITY_DN1180_c1_g1_i8.p1  ORF type:complete len:242 (-),score=23.18 TRINITY_DN1180_c1_g1_i8:443-1168(-)
MAQNSVQLQLGDKYKTKVTVSKTSLQRSTVLKGMLEDLPDEIMQPIVLERITDPINFLVVLEFMETGKMGKELLDDYDFVKFIDDVSFLGIADLQNHFIKMFEKALAKPVVQFFNKQEQQQQQYVPYDFLLHFLQENKSLGSRQSVNLFFYILEWAEQNKLRGEETLKLLKMQSVNSLEFAYANKFRKEYPEIFDLIVPASTLMRHMGKFSYQLYMEKNIDRQCLNKIGQTKINLTLLQQK